MSNDRETKTHGTFTAIFERGEDGWWVATCPEVPGAITQGQTIEEARENLKDAIELMLEVMREDAERELEGKKGVIRETLEV
ncbi:MAG: type II toxin-antitoxin system HicB family antitoxin [Actinomycetota bacterium]